MEDHNTKTTLVSLIADNIGQSREEFAQEEVDRRNQIDGTNLWRIDKSDLIYCPDETDPQVSNPCERIKGYVWITKTPANP